jgi:CubicO group peptidase (beta-lactamase class C family)
MHHVRMKTTATLVVLCAAAAIVTAQGTRPGPAPQSVGLDPARLSEASSLLQQFVADRKIAGAVAAVAHRGHVVYREAAGFQNLESRTPMTERSLFRIYSMTKAVTAVAAMILQEEGKFDLRDPASKYLPEFKNMRVQVAPGGETRAPQREITVADLLLHTSGLSHRTSELYRTEKVRSRSIALPQFITNIVRVPLMEDPGTRYRYSEGTTVVGRLIEIWSGTPLDVFIEERVLKPLGMRDTSFWVRPEDRARLTTVYAAQSDGSLRAYEIEAVPFTERPALIEGAVGLVSTVPDFMRFCQMLLNRGELDGVRMLSAKTVDLITANGLPEAVQRARGGGMGWGLANVNVVINPSAVDGSPNLGEYGWDGSAGTIFWIDPAEEMIAILMTQNVPANPDSLRQRFKALVMAARNK